MRIVRLFGAVLTILTAGLLLATPVGAQPPAKLTDHVTDTAGALSGSDRANVSSAIDRLYRDQHIQLWVVYVDNFNRFKPDNWANQTRDASGLGDNDALLAVATNTKLYAFSVPPKAQNLTPAELDSLQSKQIEPALGAKDWSRAAVAAADGLNKSTNPSSSGPSTSPSKRSWLPIAIAVGVLIVVLVVVLVLYRARRRRRARQAGPGDGHVSIEGRDDSLGQALATAEARLRQISGYVDKHRESIGTQALAQLDEARRHLTAARGKAATNESDAIAHANRASTLAAQAQTLANADVLGAHGPRRRRGAGG